MPARKAPVTGYVACRVQPSHAIRVKPLLQRRLAKCTQLTMSQVRGYRGTLRAILGFYIGLSANEEVGQSGITLTKQNNLLKKISNTANRLIGAIQSGKGYEKWSRRLRMELDVNTLHQTTKCIFTHHLLKNGIRFKEFLDMLWDYPISAEIDDPAAKALDLNFLSHLAHLATLRETPDTKLPRWPNPNLYFLVSELAPLWVEVTGRSWKHGQDISESHRYQFYEWLKSVLKSAGCYVPSGHQVNSIAKHLKIEK